MGVLVGLRMLFKRGHNIWECFFYYINTNKQEMSLISCFFIFFCHLSSHHLKIG